MTKKPLTPEQVAALNSGPAFIQELAQSFIAQDEVAGLIAGVNIVGKWLELQERQTQALEKIANMAEGVTYGNVTINVVHRD